MPTGTCLMHCPRKGGNILAALAAVGSAAVVAVAVHAVVSVAAAVFYAVMAVDAAAAVVLVRQLLPRRAALPARSRAEVQPLAIGAPRLAVKAPVSVPGAVPGRREIEVTRWAQGGH